MMSILSRTVTRLNKDMKQFYACFWSLRDVFLFNVTIGNNVTIFENSYSLWKKSIFTAWVQIL